MSILKKLQITSFRQFCLINLVFAITGSLAVFISGYLTGFLGTNLRLDLPALYWSLRVVGIFVVYQVILLAVALPFGQFHYFINVQKKMLRRFKFKIPEH